MTLQEFFQAVPRVAVAFSGGTDSALVLWAAKRYGADVCAYYARTAFQPEFEWQDAKRLAAELGVTLREVPVDILSVPEAAANGPRRCYYCKQALFQAIWETARGDGYTTVSYTHLDVYKRQGYARPEASRQEIVEAARAANIHEDIENMPDGYGTQVGERGIRLSGGQKQRIAIARAILRRSPIIILDEATASVDVETERQIQKAIGAIAGKRTIVAIAHRLSTIRWADQILVIQEGRIVEAGNHEQLLQKNGIYARMYRVQMEA